MEAKNKFLTRVFHRVISQDSEKIWYCNFSRFDFYRVQVVPLPILLFRNLDDFSTEEVERGNGYRMSITLPRDDPEKIRKKNVFIKFFWYHR